MTLKQEVETICKANKIKAKFRARSNDLACKTEEDLRRARNLNRLKDLRERYHFSESYGFY